ncbi:MAG: beta-ketoacyl synthase [Frankia sp.]
MTTSVLEFVGEPFDALLWTTTGWTAAEQSDPQPRSAQLPQPRQNASRLTDRATAEGSPALAHLRATLVVAHASALRAQTSLQRRQLAAARASNGSARVIQAPSFQAIAAGATFKPLAYSAMARLGAAELSRLAEGDIAGVFGPSYDAGGCSPDVRLAAGAELVLDEVLDIRRHGRDNGQGRMVVRRKPGADLAEATVQAAQLYALYVGLHLCLADATFVRVEPDRTRVGSTAGGNGTATNDDTMYVDVELVDLLPRPWLRVHARIGNTRVADVAVALQEKPGVPVGPAQGGRPTRWLGRVSSRGERVLLNEFHMNHLCRGDQGIAFGPEFSHYTGRKTTRLPGGGLMLVDRFVSVEGTRGELNHGTLVTEYDSPAEAWYYAETANDSMPHCVLMETSAQAALLTGYYLGATLPTPDASMSLRHLSGTATVLREVDLRDRTIRQTSSLLSTSAGPGTALQSFDYTLATDGEPFYSGKTMFGYFADEILASNQTGLDAGRLVPTWLETERPSVGIRTIDVATRRADPRARLCSRNHLALLDTVTAVDGGGRYGKGYLHAQRAISPDDWLFTWHFPLDPVLPGSFGVESVIQAVQEWMVDAGFDRGMHDPAFIIPVGLPFTWKYRGQFLPTDPMSYLEVHVKGIEARPGRLRVTADASVWKPGLRIYELTDVAVELREKGAEPW